MRKSRVVKLVLVNSVLVLAGCRRTCHVDDPKDKVAADPAAPEKRSSCTGSSHGGGFYHHYGWGRAFRGTSTTGRSATSGSVSRGGFGSTGHAAS